MQKHFTYSFKEWDSVFGLLRSLTTFYYGRTLPLVKGYLPYVRHLISNDYLGRHSIRSRCSYLLRLKLNRGSAETSDALSHRWIPVTPKAFKYDRTTLDWTCEVDSVHGRVIASALIWKYSLFYKENKHSLHRKRLVLNKLSGFLKTKVN